MPSIDRFCYRQSESWARIACGGANSVWHVPEFTKGVVNRQTHSPQFPRPFAIALGHAIRLIFFKPRFSRSWEPLSKVLPPFGLKEFLRAFPSLLRQARHLGFDGRK